MSALAVQQPAHADLVVLRGTTSTFAVLWEEDRGAGPFPVDVSAWSAKLTVHAPNGALWWQTTCECTPDGLVIATIPPTAFKDAIWDQRQRGQWKIDATSPDSHVERIGDGYIYIEQ